MSNLPLLEIDGIMALLVLIVLGATLGWLASIIARTEAPGAILRQIAGGIVVSLVAGVVANGGTMLGSLSFLGLGVALAVTAIMLVLYHALHRRKVNA
ncbi:GlsB/YeaQ/YmgE family stress response membrane protein [Erythrobacter sanguineus]|jgi:uncharacterized membrane protein YeaQ/YmgE (transglycosylase-associated protein family)|nr:hypothetical protein [Erythrobacter sanguineus]